MTQVLGCGVAATLLMVSVGATAQAQNTAPVGLEEVVVTGVRASLENAIATKREAPAIVDAISAEDIGKFPDENVAESLQRITGVQITRLRGEGQNVTIRGLPTAFSQVQLNGRTLASALGSFDSQPSRSFDFTILPSEFVRSLEVYKSPTADMEEGGLAGTVIVRTARPLDIGERLLAGSVQYAWESNSDEMSPRASFLASDVFADGKFGVAVGAAYTKRKTETHEQRITRYRRDTEARQRLDLNGDGSVNPASTGPKYGAFASEFHSIFPEERERTSFVAAMQMRPTDNLDLYLDSFYSKLDILNPRYTDLIRFDATTGPVVGTPLREVRPGNNDPLGDNGQPVDTIMRNEIRNVDQRADGRTEFREGDITAFALRGKYTLSSWKVGGEVAFSRGTQSRSFVLLENQRLADVGYDLTRDGEVAGIFFGPGEEQRRLDPSQYKLLSFNGEYEVASEDEVFDMRLDIGKELEWGLLRGVEFGAKYSDRTHFQDNKRILISSTQLQTLFGGTLPASTVFANSVQAPFLIEVSPSSGSLFGAAGGRGDQHPR